MKERLFILIVAIGFTSCYNPRFLPASESIGLNPYGSYIKVYERGNVIRTGELIAVDSISVIIIPDLPPQYRAIAYRIKKSDIISYRVQYAKSKNYGWSIPLLIAMSISQGFIGVATLPVNLIASISITSSAKNAYVYKSNHLPIGDLHKFARFPQGIPKNINITDILPADSFFKNRPNK